MTNYTVASTSLNIRNEPKVTSSNKIAVLAQGQKLDLINNYYTPWWLVRTKRHNVEIEGYVHSKFLQAEADFQPLPVSSDISVVHLKENRATITRNRDGGRAYPIGEVGRPNRNGHSINQRVSQIGEIIDWLEVDRNKRYLRKGATTYCNIYAYDFCYLAGVFIPRVWWKESALLVLAQGKTVEVSYGATVRELNANALHDWFEDFGADFGWKPCLNISQCQQEANEGKIVIACAKRVSTNRPGHICPIVPETSNNQAKRRANGDISRPLQSQAGHSNYKYKAANKWWTADKFQSFGLWVHD